MHTHRFILHFCFTKCSGFFSVGGGLVSYTLCVHVKSDENHLKNCASTSQVWNFTIAFPLCICFYIIIIFCENPLKPHQIGLLSYSLLMGYYTSFGTLCSQLLVLFFLRTHMIYWTIVICVKYSLPYSEELYLKFYYSTYTLELHFCIRIVVVKKKITKTEKILHNYIRCAQ